MASVQSSIRDKVKLGVFPAPVGAEAFSAYAIAREKGLISEMENAAHQTLDHPMTFEVLGEGLRLFEVGALNDLASFRGRCRDSLVTCIESFLEVQPPCPSSIWVQGSCSDKYRSDRVLPRWLNQLLLQNQNELKLKKFACPLDIHLRIRQEYLDALQTNDNCKACLKMHASMGLTFCAKLENSFAQARDKVTCSFYLPSITRVA